MQIFSISDKKDKKPTPGHQVLSRYNQISEDSLEILVECKSKADKLYNKSKIYKLTFQINKVSFYKCFTDETVKSKRP